jgi:hypothetical protein
MFPKKYCLSGMTSDVFVYTDYGRIVNNGAYGKIMSHYPFGNLMGKHTIPILLTICILITIK